MQSGTPRLRTVNPVKPPYELNKFPQDFPLNLCKEIVYILSTRGTPGVNGKLTTDLEGKDWEKIFAKCIGANWTPSNVGLDDVTLEQCAWSAKTVKAGSSSVQAQREVRLISGRNSLTYSYGQSDIAVRSVSPDELGLGILDIWNDRVSAIRNRHKFLRTVVLIKPKSGRLNELIVFEFDTLRYEQERFYWTWNRNGNLEGFEKGTHRHRFTWQPHGSQFTILEQVPEHKLEIRINHEPTQIDRTELLNAIEFDESWLEVIQI